MVELPAGNAKYGPVKSFGAVKFIVNVACPPVLTVCVAAGLMLDKVRSQQVLNDSVYAPGITANVSPVLPL